MKGATVDFAAGCCWSLAGNIHADTVGRSSARRLIQKSAHQSNSGVVWRAKGGPVNLANQAGVTLDVDAIVAGWAPQAVDQAVVVLRHDDPGVQLGARDNAQPLVRDVHNVYGYSRMLVVPRLQHRQAGHVLVV